MDVEQMDDDGGLVGRLPFDVFRRLCVMLAPGNLASLARTCKRLNDMVISKGNLEESVFFRIARHAIGRRHVGLLEKLLSSHSSIFLQEKTCLLLMEKCVAAHSEESAQLLLSLLKGSPKYRHVNLFAVARPGRVVVSFSNCGERDAHRIGSQVFNTFCSFSCSSLQVSKSSCFNLFFRICGNARYATRDVFILHTSD